MAPPKTTTAGRTSEATEGLKIFLCGDVMTGRGIDQVLEHGVDPELREPWVHSARQYVALAERANGPIPKPVPPACIWGDAAEAWARFAPDLRIINLETSITTSDAFWPGKGIHYRMAPANVACLQAAAPDCCVLANNHVLDFGRRGLEETLAVLDRAGLAAAGAGADAAAAGAALPLAVPGKGNVLVIGCASESSGVPASWTAAPGRPGINLLPDLSTASAEAVARQAESARRPGDTVVVSIHWGGNWGYDVPKEHRAFAHALVDSGSVDVVHGHSSHHPQGIEVYRERLILYGCGDFINDYEGIGGHEAYRPWLALMYFAALAPGSGALLGLEIVPLAIRRMRLEYAAPGDRRWLVELLNRVSGPLCRQLTFVEDDRRIVAVRSR